MRLADEVVAVRGEEAVIIIVQRYGDVATNVFIRPDFPFKAQGEGLDLAGFSLKGESESFSLLKVDRG